MAKLGPFSGGSALNITLRRILLFLVTDCAIMVSMQAGVRVRVAEMKGIRQRNETLSPRTREMIACAFLRRLLTSQGTPNTLRNMRSSYTSLYRTPQAIRELSAALISPLCSPAPGQRLSLPPRKNAVHATERHRSSVEQLAKIHPWAMQRTGTGHQSHWKDDLVLHVLAINAHGGEV